MLYNKWGAEKNQSNAIESFYKQKEEREQNNTFISNANMSKASPTGKTGTSYVSKIYVRYYERTI